MPLRIKTLIRFLWAGLAKPGQTGGLIPSQKILIERMIAPIPRTYDGPIIELGAGNGALTLRLCARCPNARVLAFEINPRLARDSRRNLDRAGINGQVELINAPAENLLAEMKQRGIAQADYVVSGIPLGNLRKQRVSALIDTIRSALAETGMYIQFQHSTVDRKKIKRRFASTRTVPVVFNFPPAVIYYATKGAPSAIESNQAANPH